MKFGKQIAIIRKERGLSQQELGKIIGIHKNVLGRYERDEVIPALDIACKIADALGVSLDHLSGKIEQEIDENVIKQVLAIQKLPEKDQDYIMFTLNALIRDSKSRYAYTG